MDLMQQIAFNVSPGPEYVETLPEELDRSQLPVRVIAYYLPQFHPIPENDAWWGRGFTDWTNVTKASPRFEGHYQPHLPIHLGFYDLRNVEVLRMQARLAASGGIGGFCFHHYWFNGRRVLDKPLKTLLDASDIDIPFCINWANENWTRRWDGQDRSVLLAQEYTAEDDVAFARSLEPLFNDARYIRVKGRPLVMLYRPSLLPDARRTVDRWREHFSRQGLADPYIIMPQGWDDEDPRQFGLDAAAGFPPHVPPSQAGRSKPVLSEDLTLFDPQFRGQVFEFADIARSAIENQPSEYTYFPGVFTAWDNDARRPGRGLSVVGSSPKSYGQWLAAACRYALKAPCADERIVFVNAWNEWAEGAHLEPDRHHGYAYLAETNRVLSGADITRELTLDIEGATYRKQSKRLGMGLGLRPRAAQILETLADRLRS